MKRNQTNYTRVLFEKQRKVAPSTTQIHKGELPREDDDIPKIKHLIPHKQPLCLSVGHLQQLCLGPDHARKLRGNCSRPLQ